MDFKDYYATLGVEPDADEQTIKRAYRKLARQYHPDVNPGDTQAEDRFKEISEAYQALSDSERRTKYDEFREQYQRWQRNPGAARGAGPGNFNWDPWQATPGEYYSTQDMSPEDLEDLFGGNSPFSDFFSSIFGQPQQDQARPGREPRPYRGRDIEAEVEITLDEAFRGTSRSFQLGERRIDASIPPGVQTGSRIRLSGQGSPGMGGGPPGDLYLTIDVTPHPQFERDGDDLRADITIDIYTAATGGSVRVPTIDGTVTLKIPPQTQADRVFRLKAKGMPRLERPAVRGALYARVKLVLPEPLSDHELEVLRALAAERREM
jgi:curved DNA-binding protein